MYLIIHSAISLSIDSGAKIKTENRGYEWLCATVKKSKKAENCISAERITEEQAKELIERANLIPTYTDINGTIYDTEDKIFQQLYKKKVYIPERI